MKYSDIKKEIYGYYNHIGEIDIDNIQDANDHIIGEHLDNSRFEEFISEFYITISMCIYMIENDLYDEYFFDSFRELLNEYNDSKNILNINDEELNNDIDNIKDYLEKDKIKSEYYDKLSELYDNN